MKIVGLQPDAIINGYTCKWQGNPEPLRGYDIGCVSAQLLDRIRAIPGVNGATFSENGLFSGTESETVVRIDGYTPSDEQAARVRYDQVGPGYFTQVGIPLLAGRDISADIPARADASR